ncbi:MAG: hypothetical protein NVS4B5_21640 [Vulcanimicrobiaceae bacterium]
MPPEFPVLRQFFGAYLNAEWPEAYGSPIAAAAAFAAETPVPRRHAAMAEIDELIATTNDPRDLADRVEALGCEYALDPRVDDPRVFLANLRVAFAMR